MKPILGSVISAGASLLGGVLANKQSAKNVASANEFTTEQMKNRHQWEVQDLRAAGLNPILSAGGTPSMGGSPVAEVRDVVGPAVNSALASKRLEAEIDKMAADTASSYAAADASKAVANNQNAQAVSTAQLTDIKKPVADVMRGAGDFTSSALSSFRKHYADAKEIFSGRRKLRPKTFTNNIFSRDFWKR